MGDKKKSFEKMDKRSIQFFMKWESNIGKSPDFNKTGTSVDYMKAK